MASPERKKYSGILGQLLSEGYRFNFFQAVRLLEIHEREGSPVGYDAPPAMEVVRFGAHPSIEFPASQIFDVKSRKDADHPTQMTVTFFGMFGPLGALPLHYSEIIIDRAARKDRTLLEFLDLFNHRLISLFFRAWEKYQFWISSERALRHERFAIQEGPQQYRRFVLENQPKLDPVGQILLSLVGLGNPASRYALPGRESLEPRTKIADQTWRFYSGLLSNRHRSASGLQSILSDCFGWSVKVQPLCGRWLQLEQTDQTRLKRGWNTTLGQGTVAGRKVWEVQGKFRLIVGALNYEQFCSMLPIGTTHRPFVQLVRFYVGLHLDFDLELQLLASEIPVLRAGDKTGIGGRLGWNTWLKNRKIRSDVVSAMLRPYDDRLD